MERDAITFTEMDDKKISGLNKGGAIVAWSTSKEETTIIYALVFIARIEWVTKSHMTGGSHVRFCDQLRGGNLPWLTRLARTEIDTDHTGTIQRLMVSCRLHDVNPYDYLIDLCSGSTVTRRTIPPPCRRFGRKKFADNLLRLDGFNMRNSVLE